MEPKQNSLPWWLPRVTVVKIGKRWVFDKRRGKRRYYYYFKVPVESFPQIVNAKRVVLLVTTPDLSLAPIQIPARRHQATSKHVFFEAPGRYRFIVDQYFPNGTVALLNVEVLEKEKVKPAAERDGP